MESENIRKAKRLFHLAQAELYSRMNKNPEKSLKFIGVTGTSGKTTTVNIIYHMLNSNGFRVGLISTTGAKIGDKEIETGLHVTTPDAKDMYAILKQMADAGVEYVVLEASSHALAQGRFGRIDFNFAVYTNIKRDHLDWHGTWGNYVRAKSILIQRLAPKGIAVLNKDDRKVYEYLNNVVSHKKDIKSVGYSKESEVQNLIESSAGISFILNNVEFYLPILGEYNVENVLAAVEVGKALGLSTGQIAESLKTFPGVEGRMQLLQSSPYMVIVNFSHNADSLEKSLKSVRKFIANSAKLIVVFGSAGLRDVEKRYAMGKIAARYANVVIITAEDPRTEKLEDINNEIIRGAESEGGKLVKRFKNHNQYKDFILDLEASPAAVKGSYLFVFDEESVQSRFDAIDFAVRIATPGDVVITEGKGHEKSLAFGDIEHPFSDQEAIKKALSGIE